MRFGCNDSPIRSLSTDEIGLPLNGKLDRRKYQPVTMDTRLSQMKWELCQFYDRQFQDVRSGELCTWISCLWGTVDSSYWRRSSMRALCFNIRGRNYSQMAPEPRIPRKFSPAKVNSHTVCTVPHVSMYVCIHAHTYACTHDRTHARTYASTHACTHTRTNAQKCTHIHKCTHIRTQI